MKYLSKMGTKVSASLVTRFGRCTLASLSATTVWRQMRPPHRVAGVMAANGKSVFDHIVRKASKRLCVIPAGRVRGRLDASNANALFQGAFAIAQLAIKNVS